MVISWTDDEGDHEHGVSFENVIGFINAPGCPVCHRTNSCKDGWEVNLAPPVVTDEEYEKVAEYKGEPGDNKRCLRWREKGRDFSKAHMLIFGVPEDIDGFMPKLLGITAAKRGSEAYDVRKYTLSQLKPTSSWKEEGWLEKLTRSTDEVPKKAGSAVNGGAPAQARASAAKAGPAVGGAPAPRSSSSAAKRPNSGEHGPPGKRPRKEAGDAGHRWRNDGPDGDYEPSESGSDSEYSEVEDAPALQRLPNVVKLAVVMDFQEFSHDEAKRFLKEIKWDEYTRGLGDMYPPDWVGEFASRCPKRAADTAQTWIKQSIKGGKGRAAEGDVERKEACDQAFRADGVEDPLKFMLATMCSHRTAGRIVGLSNLKDRLNKCPNIFAFCQAMCEKAAAEYRAKVAELLTWANAVEDAGARKAILACVHKEYGSGGSKGKAKSKSVPNERERTLAFLAEGRDPTDEDKARLDAYDSRLKLLKTFNPADARGTYHRHSNLPPELAPLFEDSAKYDTEKPSEDLETEICNKADTKREQVIKELNEDYSDVVLAKKKAKYRPTRVYVANSTCAQLFEFGLIKGVRRLSDNTIVVEMPEKYTSGSVFFGVVLEPGRTTAVAFRPPGKGAPSVYTTNDEVSLALVIDGKPIEGSQVTGELLAGVVEKVVGSYLKQPDDEEKVFTGVPRSPHNTISGHVSQVIQHLAFQVLPYVGVADAIEAGRAARIAEIAGHTDGKTLAEQKIKMGETIDDEVKAAQREETVAWHTFFKRMGFSISILSAGKRYSFESAHTGKIGKLWTDLFGKNDDDDDLFEQEYEWSWFTPLVTAAYNILGGRCASVKGVRLILKGEAGKQQTGGDAASYFQPDRWPNTQETSEKTQMKMVLLSTRGTVSLRCPISPQKVQPRVALYIKPTAEFKFEGPAPSLPMDSDGKYVIGAEHITGHVLTASMQKAAEWRIGVVSNDSFRYRTPQDETSTPKPAVAAAAAAASSSTALLLHTGSHGKVAEVAGAAEAATRIAAGGTERQSEWEVKRDTPLADLQNEGDLTKFYMWWIILYSLFNADKDQYCALAVTSLNGREFSTKSTENADGTWEPSVIRIPGKAMSKIDAKAVTRNTDGLDTLLSEESGGLAFRNRLITGIKGPNAENRVIIDPHQRPVKVELSAKVFFLLFIPLSEDAVKLTTGIRWANFEAIVANVPLPDNLAMVADEGLRPDAVRLLHALISIGGDDQVFRNINQLSSRTMHRVATAVADQSFENITFVNRTPELAEIMMCVNENDCIVGPDGTLVTDLSFFKHDGVEPVIISEDVYMRIPRSQLPKLGRIQVVKNPTPPHQCALVRVEGMGPAQIIQWNRKTVLALMHPTDTQVLEQGPLVLKPTDEQYETAVEVDIGKLGLPNSNEEFAESVAGDLLRYCTDCTKAGPLITDEGKSSSEIKWIAAITGWGSLISKSIETCGPWPSCRIRRLPEYIAQNPKRIISELIAALEIWAGTSPWKPVELLPEIAPAALNETRAGQEVMFADKAAEGRPPVKVIPMPYEWKKNRRGGYWKCLPAAQLPPTDVIAFKLVALVARASPALIKSSPPALKCVNGWNIVPIDDSNEELKAICNTFPPAKGSNWETNVRYLSYTSRVTGEPVAAVCIGTSPKTYKIITSKKTNLVDDAQRLKLTTAQPGGCFQTWAAEQP